MAKLPSRAQSLVLLSLFLFLFISIEMPMAEAKLCQRRSKTWSGPCIISGNCANECKSLEKAVHGACHAHFPGFACFCYFNC